MKSADLSRLPRAVKAYINKLETRLAERDARIDESNQRLDALDRQYRLALAQQYAPKSESAVAGCLTRPRKRPKRSRPTRTATMR